MSDSRRVHRAIKRTLTQLYPERPQGNLARHMDTLAGMVSGIVLSKSCQLPKIASKVPGEVHPDSRTKQMSRWVQNEGITFDLYFCPLWSPCWQVWPRPGRWSSSWTAVPWHEAV